MLRSGAKLLLTGNHVKHNITVLHDPVQIVANPLLIRGLLPAPMTHPDARTRVRQRIKRLLDDRGFTQGAFARALGHRDQWASNFFKGAFSLSLDQLDDAATFLGVTPGEIVRVSDEPWELTPTEMRMIRALRMLPAPVREMVVTQTDYMVGVVPEEAELIVKIRNLTDEEYDGMWHYVGSMEASRDAAHRKAKLADQPPATMPRPGRVRRTRAGGRK